MKKKYYIVITPFFPSETNFRGPFIYDQVEEIKKHFDGEIVIFKTYDKTKVNDYQYRGFQVIGLKQYNLPSNILPGLFYKLSSNHFLEILKRNKISIDEIAVVHMHSASSVIYTNMLKEKNESIIAVAQSHGLDVLGKDNGKLRNMKLHHDYLSRFYAKIYQKVDYIVGVSQATIESFNTINGFNNIKKIVLYNGVNKNKFYKKDGQKKQQNHIGCVANLIDLKDHITLLKAALILLEKKINFHITIVGQGINKNKLLNFVKENNLLNRVTFIDALKHEELVDFYNSIDIYVMPSYYESLGCVYLEAHSCGVPFIAVENQGITELIQDKESWIIPKSDEKKLALLLENYFKQKKEQKLVKNIDIKKTIPEFLEKIKQINRVE